MMHATEVVGYAMDADTYCVGCAGDILGGTLHNDGTFTANDDHPNAVPVSERTYDQDELRDTEGNVPAPIFGSTVHTDGPDYCGRCHELLAPYECAICGDEHGESAHGEPLVQRDLGRDTLVGFVQTALWDAGAILDGPYGENIPDTDVDATDAQNALGKLYREWNASTDDERDEHAPEYLDDIDAILADAGYLSVTDADQGTWAVYRPAPESADAAAAILDGSR